MRPTSDHNQFVLGLMTLLRFHKALVDRSTNGKSGRTMSVILQNMDDKGNTFAKEAKGAADA